MQHAALPARVFDDGTGIVLHFDHALQPDGVHVALYAGNGAAQVREQIQRVDRLVDERAAALRGPGSAPAAFPVIGGFAPPGDFRAGAQKGPLLAGIHDGFQRAGGRVIAVLENDA